MFIACPHCHELVATRPQPRQSPELCPRCGGALQLNTGTPMPTDGPPARSFATLLRGSETPAPTPEPPPAGASAMSPETETGTEPPAVAPLPPAAATAAPTSVAHSTEGTTQPPDATETTAEAEPFPSSSVIADPVEMDDAADHPDGSVPPAEPIDLPASAPARATAASPPATSARTPSFTRNLRSTPERTGAPKAQWLVLGALSLLLVIQVLLADRARLAADAGWRPLLVSLCGALRCSLPPWREPQAFVMLSRDVRPVVGIPGTLQAQAAFRNDARWPQPWPILLLTLKDADGRTLGARALTPDEYLDASVDGDEIAPGQSAQIAVRIREPSASVVAYSFDFR
jgi:hypothetical protein